MTIRSLRSDNPELSARRRYRETPEVVSATKRLIRVIGKRVATEDAEDLLLLADLERELEQAWVAAIAGLRATGLTDRRIGVVLGTTKQAVSKRWPREEIVRK